MKMRLSLGGIASSRAGLFPKPMTEPIQREVTSKVIDRFAARGDARPPHVVRISYARQMSDHLCLFARVRGAFEALSA